MTTSVTPPREGNETIAGVGWLARMLDKARLKNQGTIDQFDLVYPCPMDQRLLSQLNISADTFQEIANTTQSDEQVIEALKQANATL